MQPRPIAETSGPFFPSWRCGICLSSLASAELDEWSAVSGTDYASPGPRIVRYNENGARANCFTFFDPVMASQSKVASALPFSPSAAPTVHEGFAHAFWLELSRFISSNLPPHLDLRN